MGNCFMAVDFYFSFPMPFAKPIKERMEQEQKSKPNKLN